MQLIEGMLVLSPSDLVAYAGCEHRTALDRLVARGELTRAGREDAFAALIRAKGAGHEQRHLDSLRAAGLEAVTIPPSHGGVAELEAGEAATLAAMRSGAGAIYQATFFDGRWRGHADFLIRLDGVPSELGSWSYEVQDTKLARRVRAAALVQLAEYSRQLTRLQGRAPERLHVIGGDGAMHSFPYAEISAYVETLRRRFEDAVDHGLSSTRPEPVADCAVCDWRDRCRRQWRDEDHLSLVAGVRRDQRARLEEAGIATRRALAGLDMPATAPRMSESTLVALRDQARAQVASEDCGSITWTLIPPDDAIPGRGLAAMPEPSANDLFFDMEGDPFVDGGREYLFGWVEGPAAHAPFHAAWAHGAAEEKLAFERFVDAVMEARRRDAGMHVYHYASYEVSAVKRLMARHQTRETEVDELLRAGVFVDLHRVVVQAVRIGVESYSIKTLEPLYQGPRQGAVIDAGMSVVQYEAWLEEGDPAQLDAIRAYNEADCRSLVGLRHWLEQRRVELERASGCALPRPLLRSGEASEKVTEAAAEVEEVAAALLAAGSTDGHRLLAGLLDWHRREEKPQWWEHFSRLQATDEELIEDGTAIGGLVFDGDEDEPGSAMRLYRFRFPAQETRLRAGENVADPRGVDLATGEPSARSLGAIHHLDTTACVVVFRRRKSFDRLPTALIPTSPPPSTTQRASLLELGRWVVTHGFDAPGPWRAARDLIVRGPPHVQGGIPGAAVRQAGEGALEATRRCVRDAVDSCLPVQGPPGSGKTHAGALSILDLVTSTPRRRVAVTALSHRAISHFLDVLCHEAADRGVPIRIIQKCPDDAAGSSAEQVRRAADNGAISAALEEDTVDVVAGTSWLFSRPEMADRFDTLVVDEAGQLSLANVVAISRCARNLVLLGDPQQLEQPSAGVHPEGAAASALSHLAAGHETIPPDRGIFLDLTWRMHPDVCAYVSQVFYESRLQPEPDCARQRVDGADPLGGTGLRWLPVEHAGNRSRSVEEAETVAALVQGLVGRYWTDRDGQTRPLRGSDVLVVAPYNAQAATLREHLPPDVPVGTVDRFQGQQGAVVIYSMATSLAEDVPRGMEFLYSAHRMNVAISRALCMAIVVCSPRLLEVRCVRAEQIRDVNALCAFVLGATELRADVAPVLVGATAHGQTLLPI